MRTWIREMVAAGEITRETIEAARGDRMSPFERRRREGQLPVADLTGDIRPGTQCSHCGRTFATTQARNIHLMRRHADRRTAYIEA